MDLLRLAAVGEVDEMPNPGTGHFGETALIRLLVRLGAEPHSPVASSDKSQGAAAVVALVRGHCLLLYSATNKSDADCWFQINLSAHTDRSEYGF